ncbi:STY4528 family pathogenicity island replication protein [uncultured Porticoccus sp.]|uniref:STY4528 family pathogenicity island replication protein n=1 Tax=uncultured Porticoccus sp. TaxID=1256050 RepID=UPI00263604FF|nr:STY4528 family pathogenicity island replication protein [uncultured Porticoccus sp.]
MASETPGRDSGPAALTTLLDDAAQRLDTRPATFTAQDGFLFSGNRHESVPRALFLDRRLTPLERNAWQVFRLLLNDDGITAFPTYERLRPYLASMPCTAKASHETVARALTQLRLTRWLSLVRRRRDPRSGRLLGNLYVLHDEPLSPFEAMQLDTEYLGLVSQALTHAAKAVRIVGTNALREITEDPLISGRTLPSRLQVMAERLAGQNWHGDATKIEPVDNSKTEESAQALLRDYDEPSSKSESGRKGPADGILPIPTNSSTVRKRSIKNSNVRTVLNELLHLNLPPRFDRLDDEQKAGALLALRKVDRELQQPVIDEWDVRCCDSYIKKPVNYLFGLIQKAIRGEFHAWAGVDPIKEFKAERSAPHIDGESTGPTQPSDPEQVKAHIARLQAIFQKG